MENTAFQYTSQDMAPVLARLNAAYALYRDSRDRRPMARVQLTGVVSDLMALNLSEHEVEMVADVLIALARQAEVDLRKAMAERLSALDNVPVRLVMQMANDEIAVARPVLKSSPVLGEAELTEIIAAKGPAHWQVIAQRAHLPEAVIDRLADTHDHGTAQALAENIARGGRSGRHGPGLRGSGPAPAAPGGGARRRGLAAVSPRGAHTQKVHLEKL